MESSKKKFFFFGISVNYLYNRPKWAVKVPKVTGNQTKLIENRPRMTEKLSGDNYFILFDLFSINYLNYLK